MEAIRLVLVLLSFGSVAFAWIPQARSVQRLTSKCSSSATLTRNFMTASALDPQQKQQLDQTQEYEVVEYDYLTDADFLGSEWAVGTLFGNDKKVQETWVRLARTEDGKNICFWGTNEQGTWNLDVASQFLSISREKLYGKEIWACTVDDFYFLSGTVRGWAFWKAASVSGQWQAVRLGVDPEEAGTAPWFEDEEEDGDSAK